jgi:flagellar biosynthesis anti-sigma factor FlgM
MPNRIKGPDSGAIEGAGRNRSVARPTGVARTGASAPASTDSVESVHITSAAHQMLALQQHIAETPDVDVAKVQKLRADIDQNRYQIDSGHIADRLLQLEGDLQASAKSAKSGQNSGQ